MPAKPVRDNAKAWQSLAIVALLAVAFAARLAVRIAFGPDYFWINSYSIYYALAANLVGGKGFCLHDTCAWLPPLYPLFLIPSVLAGKNFLLIVVPQALIGAATAWCAFLIGREIFNSRVGALACAMTALYPYYLMHDTALQDTGMATFGTALAVWLLLRARRWDRFFDWFLAGLVLGGIALVRASLAPAIAVGIIWCIVCGASGGVTARLGKGAMIAFAALLVMSPWLTYTYRVTGVPIIDSQNGIALWTGNNPDTFSHYPGASIDRSRAEAMRHLSAADRAEVKRLAGHEIAQSNWFAARALRFIRANPAVVLRGALRKLAAGFSWRLNPWRALAAEVAYLVGYLPVAVLGIAGMVLAAGRRETILVAMLFLAFIAVTAVFWAHTSHRSYLDVYWIVFAASVIDRLWAGLRAAGPAAAATPLPQGGPP